MDGLELAARFSYITNSMHYCGPSAAGPAFLRYLEKKDNAEEVRAGLEKFEGLYAYLSVIAEATGKDFTDYDVVQAYWIGSQLLDKLDHEHLKEIIRRLVQRGFPAKLAEERIKHMPRGVAAHHDFNVLYMGVGLTSGKVEPTLANMENCRINTGRVVEVATNLTVMAHKLLYKDGKFLLSEEEPRTVTYLPEMLGPVKLGDIVAIHWGFAPLILTKEQYSTWEKYTKRIRDALNESSVKPLGI